MLASGFFVLLTKRTRTPRQQNCSDTGAMCVRSSNQWLNCSSSVEPSSAVVDASPLVTVSWTWSK